MREIEARRYKENSERRWFNLEIMLSSISHLSLLSNLSNQTIQIYKNQSCHLSPISFLWTKHIQKVDWKFISILKINPKKITTNSNFKLQNNLYTNQFNILKKKVNHIKSSFTPLKLVLPYLKVEPKHTLLTT
jgi:hypothetical protein